ncbi:MAG: hypothetical protein WKG07_01930 [Hymenobacter sp.]
MLFQGLIQAAAPFAFLGQVSGLQLQQRPQLAQFAGLLALLALKPGKLSRLALAAGARRAGRGRGLLRVLIAQAG